MIITPVCHKSARQAGGAALVRLVLLDCELMHQRLQKSTSTHAVFKTQQAVAGVPVLQIQRTLLQRTASPIG